MKKYIYLIVLALILGLVLTGCFLSNVGQVPTNEQSGVTYLTKGGTQADPESFHLYAGQNILVGTVEVSNDTEYLYVTYMVDAPWCLTETHLAVAINLDGIPQTKKDNPIPGQFPYQCCYDEDAAQWVFQIKEDGDENAVCDADDSPETCLTPITYTIPLPLDLAPDTELFIAAHAVVKNETITFDTCMIDFEEFLEYDDVSSVMTDCGEVKFFMVDYLPLMGLSIDETAILTVKDDLPVIAEENTMGANYYGLVAFTSNSGGMKDDLVLNDSGTGAGGKMLTDALDYSQTPLLYHAYTKYQAILVDVSDVLNVDTLNFVGIDLDHNELWHFQYFDENDVLIADVTVGPGTGEGDGKAYQADFTDPRISKVAIWGEQNLDEPERLGFAIDNIEVTTKTVTVQEETAWGAVSEGVEPFLGNNWATYFTYVVELPPVCSLSITGNIKDISWGFRNTDFDLLPNDIPITFAGTVNATGLQNNGAVFIGLLDKKYVDDGNSGWMGGAYAYFGRRGNNLVIGPTDGNFGGEIVQVFKTFTDYFSSPTDIYFTMVLHANSISITVNGDVYTDSYGEIKALNSKVAYAWDEFEHGAYVGIDSWPYDTYGINDVTYDVIIDWCTE